MATEKVITLTNNNFDRTFSEAELMVIDFWAPWCEPCKDFSRILDEVAMEFPNFCFGTINVDQEKELALDFQIKSVPTLVIFRKKIMILHQSGIIPKSALVDLLNQALALPESYFEEKE